MDSRRDMMEQGSSSNPSTQASMPKKTRPRHADCQFQREGLCTNKESLFFGEVRIPEAPFCSNFRRRESNPETAS